MYQFLVIAYRFTLPNTYLCLKCCPFYSKFCAEDRFKIHGLVHVKQGFKYF